MLVPDKLKSALHSRGGRFCASAALPRREVLRESEPAEREVDDGLDEREMLRESGVCARGAGRKRRSD